MHPNRMHPDEQAPICGISVTLPGKLPGLCGSIKFEEFEKNKVLRYAVERQLNLIGDVSSQISPKFRKNHPEIKWNKRIKELGF